MNTNTVASIFLAGCLLPASLFGQKGWERLNEKVKRGEVRVTKVMIMPARAALNKEGFKGSEGMTKEADQLAVKFTREAAEVVRAAGLQVLPSPFEGQDARENEDRKAELLRLQNQFDEVHKQIDPNKGAHTLWGGVKDVRAAGRRVKQGSAKVTEDSMGDTLAGSDALIFPRISGGAQTGGKRAMQGVAGWMLKTNVSYDLTFVSTQTGEVLASYAVVHTSSIKKQMDKPVFKGVKGKIEKAFVKGKKKGKANKSGDVRAAGLF